MYNHSTAGESEGNRMPPTVSIALCCYNSERYLEETLQSIFAQTYHDWELVIVNDGSTDSTEQIIQRHMAEGRHIVYSTQPNCGLGAARNKAIELSQGEFIALIDHDDVWDPEKLEQQLKLFAKRPEVGVVYSAVHVLVPGARTGAPAPFRPPMYRGNVFVPLVLCNFVASSTLMIRRACLEKVGWFNPSLCLTEEYELLLRLAEHYEFDYVDKPLVTYRLHEGNASWNGAQLQLEMATVVRQALDRHPWLATHLGTIVTRIKRAGFSFTHGVYYLLRGRVRMALQWYRGWGLLLRALLQCIGLFVLVFLPLPIAVACTGWLSRKRKSRMLGA